MEKFGLSHVVIDNGNASAQAQANELLKTRLISFDYRWYETIYAIFCL
jgi:hypothetical protein